MKKVLTAAQLKATDEFTIDHEPIKSIDLMERASQCFVQSFMELFPNKCAVLVLVGPGNNGGDGLAIGRLLHMQGYAIQVASLPDMNFSKDVQVNRARLGFPMKSLNEYESFESFDVIIDALFGSGLSRPIEGQYKIVIESVNAANKTVVAVDLPSGLIPDRVQEGAAIIRATHTLTFQSPKLTFLIPETGGYCGEVQVLDIGLDLGFIERLACHYYVIEASDVQLAARKKFAHKGRFGHVQLFAGSKGKMGAAVLCTKAALLSGAGLATTHIPARGESIVQISVPEAMVVLDDHQDIITNGQLLPKTNAICIGPGIGKDRQTTAWLHTFLAEANLPMVLDADALHILASHQELLSLVAGKAILTPHLGELERLLGPTKNGIERLEGSLALAAAYDLIILIKGAHSSVVTPAGDVYFNSTGNAGMAKGGSGDVLAGLIAGFLAQGFSREEATIKAVYLHGAAGDSAKKDLGEYSIMASDLLERIPQAICNVSLASFI